MGSGPKPFHSHQVVPESGIYRVVHSQHRLPHEVVCFKGQRFPRCARCTDDVLFNLVHAAPDLYRSWNYVIYELPVLEDTESQPA